MPTIIDEILLKISELSDSEDEPTPDTPLIGDDRFLDSMSLVELCLFLEDTALSFGFTFDWSSEVAMSKQRSFFRTPSSLAEEFERQRLNLS